MDDTTQSTDVGGATPAAIVEESTSAAAPSVSPQESSPTAGGVTAGAEASEVEQGGATPPPPDDDPLKGIPTSEELQQQVEQKVPYAAALLQLRKALEARNEENQRLQQQFEPLKGLSEIGEPEVVKTAVEAFNSLFTPVVNPETQQPEFDEVSGVPRYTTAPFIERMESENPGFTETLLFDALNSKVEYPDGQKLPLFRNQRLHDVLMRAWGYDPSRGNDYRNIDALAQPAASVTPEDLEKIPAEFHETFKSLPAGIRNDLLQRDEDTRKFDLETYKERFDRKAQEEQRQQAEQQQQQAQIQQFRQQVNEAQESFVSQHLREGYASIMDDLASKVTFSSDPAQSEGIKSAIGALLFSLRDPDFREANKSQLEAAGIKLGGDFDEALNLADKHLRDAKAYELVGQKARARNSLNEAATAKKLVLAKLSPIALRYAQTLGAQVVSRANGQNQLLQGASTVRPTPNGGTEPEGDGTTMRANAPGYGLNLWKQINAANQAQG
ncbi:MAG TPA: hypothetical protein VN256_13175 [Pyrinomonadaceae bacterium]|nr:hypothetical protein [Pyrinomonadaceae bacterium]